MTRYQVVIWTYDGISSATAFTVEADNERLAVFVAGQKAHDRGIASGELVGISVTEIDEHDPTNLRSA